MCGRDPSLEAVEDQGEADRAPALGEGDAGAGALAVGAGVVGVRMLRDVGEGVGNERPLVAVPVLLGGHGEVLGGAAAEQALEGRELVLRRAAERLQERGGGAALPEAVADQDEAARAGARRQGG